MMLSILSCVSGPFDCPPWRSVCSSPLPIFNWIVCHSGIELYEFFIYFGDQTFVQGIVGICDFPYGWFPFHFDDIFFSHAEDFKFDIVPFDYFSFIFCAQGDILARILLCEISEILLPMFSARIFMVS